MKYLLRLLLVVTLTFSAQLNTLVAQCTFGGTAYPPNPITPTTTWTPVSQFIYGGDYGTYNVVIGNTYQWSYCAADGGVITFDGQLTLFDALNTSVALAYSDDDCDNNSPIITWTATFTGQVYVQVNQFNCGTNTTNSTLMVRISQEAQILGCTFLADNYPSGIFTPTSAVYTAAATNIFAGEYSAYNVIAGNTYEWSLCAADGGSATYDSELSLYDALNTSNAIVYSDDACGDDAKITWTADFTGQVYVQVNQFNCQINSTNTTLVYRRSAVAGAAPANDNCAGATVINVNDFCLPTNGTVASATTSTPTTVCTGTNSDDVWYRFTVNNTSLTLNFEVLPSGTGFDPVLEVFGGTSCTSMSSILCVDNGGDGIAEGFNAAPGVIPAGSVIWVRVYDYFAAAANNPNFTVCAYYSQEFAEGDDCENATFVPTNLFCDTPVAGNFGDYTASVSNGNDCVTPILSDVWYTFQATSDSVFFDVTPTGLSNPVVEIYSGIDCANLAFIGCGNFQAAGVGESIVLFNATVGETFYVKIYDAGGNTAADLGYTFCVYSEQSPVGPQNNECDGATTIIAGTSCFPVAGTLAEATASLPTTTCGGTNNEDVWYELVASDTAMIVEITPDFSTLGIVAELFASSTNDCQGLISFGCADAGLAGQPEIFTITGIQAGQSIWVRIYDFQTAAPVNPTFTICAYWDASVLIPDNDECAGAITLTPSATCNPLAFTNANATASAPTTSCSLNGIADQDVWFKFVAQSTSAIIRVESVNLSDPVIQYFSGSCANLVSRGCSDVFVEGNFENLTATGLTVGTTYYVRVYDYRGAGVGPQDFTICIINNPTAPANDNCAGAVPITVSDPANAQFFNTALATQSAAGCSGNANDDVWFSFIAGENPAGTQIEVLGDLDFSSVFQLYSGTCANLTSLQCVNADAATAQDPYDFENQTFTNLTPGQQYYIRAYDSDASVTNSTFYIRLRGTPVGCNLAAPVATANGSIDICGNGGVSLSTPLVNGLSYQWRLNGNVIPGASSNTYTATTTGNYTVVISDALACTAESNTIGVQVTPQPVVSISAASTTTICTGGSVVLSATNQPGLTWQWFRNNIQINGATSPSYTANQSGSYTLVATAEGFCTGTSNAITVNVISAPTAVVTASGNTTICQGSNIILSVAAQEGTTIQWRLNGVNINGATESTYSANQAGSYTAVVSAGGNCSTTSNALSISVVPGPSASIAAGGSTTFCQGNNVVLTANPVSGATYQWLNNGVPILGSTGTSYTATASGSYAILVNTTSCNATSNIIDVVVNPVPVAVATPAGETTFCTGGSVTLNANPVQGALYQWLNGGNPIAGANSSSYTATSAGSYSVNVISNGCLATSNALVVTVNPPPTATITANGSTTVCQGSPVVLNANTGAGLSYQWFLNGTPIGAATNASYSATIAGNYTVTVSQGSNCSSTSNAANVNILALPQVSVTASGSLAVCQGSSVNLSASPTAGNTFQWQVGGANISGATNSTYAANAAGSYAVVVTSGNGCSATSTPSVVTINPLPSATITPNGPTTFCVGGNVLLQANSGNGLNYQWLNGGVPIQGALNSVLNVSQSGTYSVTVGDLNQCSATSTPITVNVAGVQAEITYSGQPAICDGEAVVLSANAGSGLTYQWLNNGNTLAGETSQTYTATIGGNYSVTVTDLNNCTSNSAVQTITVGESPAVPVVTADGPTKFCEGGSVELSTTFVAGITYQWLNAGTAVAGATTNSFTATENGEFTLTAVNTSGCLSESDNVSVEVNPNPVVTFTLNPDTTCINQEFTLQGGAPSGGTYSGTGVTGTSFTSSTPGTFTITYAYVDDNDCSASATDELKVFSCSSIEELLSSEIQLYPNPTSNDITLEIPVDLNVQTIQVNDLSGRLVEVHLVKTANNRYQIASTSLASGTYQVVILTDDYRLVKRFVKTH